MTMTKRAKKLVKMLERLLKQEHLYSDEQIKEIKAQLKTVKEEIVRLEEQTSKGFKKVK
jgi:hypothetical protein